MKTVNYNKIDWEKHRCETLVIFCMDFRIPGDKLREVLTAAFSGQEKIAPFDEIRIAGGAKAVTDKESRQTALAGIQIAVYKHSIGRIIIVNHHDCGAYGGISRFNGNETAERDFHSAELKKAEKIVIDFLASIGKSNITINLAYLSATKLIPV